MGAFGRFRKYASSQDDARNPRGFCGFRNFVAKKTIMVAALVPGMMVSQTHGMTFPMRFLRAN
jgi:hypothetical protein